jgi:hypothetical protein
MEEKTADEIAAIFSAAGDSVTVIGTAKTSDEITGALKLLDQQILELQQPSATDQPLDKEASKKQLKTESSM